MAAFNMLIPIVRCGQVDLDGHGWTPKVRCFFFLVFLLVLVLLIFLLVLLFFLKVSNGFLHTFCKLLFDQKFIQ